MIRIILFALTFCVVSINIKAQVVINEYSAANLNVFTDSFNKTEDWIELYNSSTSAVDLSDWHLSDKESKPGKWSFPVGTTIAAQDHLIIFCSGRDGLLNGQLHSNFKLSQTKGSDIVLLSDPNENVLEMHQLDLLLVEHSHCRETDGSDNWKICTLPTYGVTNNGSSQINGYTATPEMSLNAGFYKGIQTVIMTNNESNSILRYTTDGTNPTTNSEVYNGAIKVEKTMVIKAQAFSNDPTILPGKMDFNTYFIDEEFSLAVFSIGADDVIDLANGEGDLIPIGSLEYFNLDNEREAVSFGSLNRHGQDSWVLDHRSLDWVSRDEMGYSKAVEAPLFNFSDRDEYQKFMFRNSGDDNYPSLQGGFLDEDHMGSTHIRDEYVQTLAQLGEMQLDIRSVERVILFLNGEYWGVYGMRDRPVDHDYTDYYYDQGKFDVQYLTTWATTEIQYGGGQALQDWMSLRNFILLNDMSLPENYQIAEDSLNMTSLIDYFLLNQNVVAADWLNYNTGWWRGLNPEGKHKKWGYILWDLDAVFDYYINYTGVPNTSPTAKPCDLEVIGESMDGFFGQFVGGGLGGLEIPNPQDCQSITNGSSPYPATDSIFVATVNFDNFCCEEWDGICQDIYDNFLIIGIDGPEACPTILDGSCPYPITDETLIATLDANPACCDSWSGTCDATYNFIASGGRFSNDVGQHEKLLLKLYEENETFRQLYYGRYADLMNTVFDCDNMMTLLDSMLNVIRPEMPKQTERWGGSVDEWEENVEELKEFIEQRCTLLDDGALDCFDELSGPYTITLRTEPDGIGEIDFNTLDIESFPWSGDYFGGMDNTIKAKVFDINQDDFEFSHWVSSTNNMILPSVQDRKAKIRLTQNDTLTAVFKIIGSTSTEDLIIEEQINVYPNPAIEYLMLNFKLDKTTDVKFSLTDLVGRNVLDFNEFDGVLASGHHSLKLDIANKNLSSGMYLLKLNFNGQMKSHKVNIISKN